MVIDNYYSFTYNLVDYLGRISRESIKVARNDEISIGEIKKMRPKNIVISLGSKTPAEAGIAEDVIRTYYQTVPSLGLCRGHQAIGEVFWG